MTEQEKYVIPAGDAGKKKLAEKEARGKTYTHAVLARSVKAKTITLAQAKSHRPDFTDYVQRRKDLGLPTTATGRQVAEAKAAKAPKQAKAAAANKATPKAERTITATEAKKLTKAQLIELLGATGL